MSEIVVLKVGMSCKGCVGAVERVLAKMEGVESYNVDIEQQKVTVKGNVQPQVVFEKVSKTGKKTEFWKEESKANEPTTVETPKEVTDTPKEVASPAPSKEVASPAPSKEVAHADAKITSEAPKEAPTGVATA